MRQLFLLLLIGLLTTISVTSAADIPTLYCGQLAETDCALLNNALASLPNLKSAQFKLTAEIGQNTGDEPLTIMDISGSLRGSLTFEMLQTPEGYYDLMRGLEADLTFSSTLLRASETPGPDAHIILLDGILYADLDSLQTVLHDDTLPNWGCYDMNGDLLKRVAEMRTQASSSFQPLVTGFDLDVLVDSIGKDVAGQYARVTRTDDANKSAIFETRIDIAGLYFSPAFREAFRQQAPNQIWYRGDRFSTITDEQLNRLQGVAARLFPDPVIINRYQIDLDTGFFSSVFSWRPDEWLYTIQSALREGGESYQTISSISFTLELGRFNQVAAISIPENAQPFPIRRLNQIEPIWGMLSSFIDHPANISIDAGC